MTCTCGHLQTRHKGGKQGCRGCDIGCARFEPDDEAVAVEETRVLTAVAEVCEDQADHARAKLGQQSTSARLREAEQERDAAEAGQRSAAAFQRKAEKERDLACAELATARAELDRLRAAADGYLQAGPPPAGPAEVLYAYDAWQCLRPAGCGSRYIPATAAEDHPHPLTAVRVTITHRTEGHTE